MMNFGLGRLPYISAIALNNVKSMDIFVDNCHDEFYIILNISQQQQREQLRKTNWLNYLFFGEKAEALEPW